MNAGMNAGMNNPMMQMQMQMQMQQQAEQQKQQQEQKMKLLTREKGLLNLVPGQTQPYGVPLPVGSGSDANGYGLISKQNENKRQQPGGFDGRARGGGYHNTASSPNNNRPSYHWYKSSIMQKSEIDTLLRIQWAATHAGRPYFEDYYYLAFLKKEGDLKGKFSPIEVFAEDEKRGMQAHLAVDGLGKIPLPNIRRPKPLMDLGANNNTNSDEAGKNSDGEKGESSQKSLDQEPLLAARVMIEDGLGWLLDVDDVDRMLEEREINEEDADELNKRRSALLESIASSFHLPEGNSPILDPNDPSGDSVFLYLAHLRKGQKLIASFLNLCKEVQNSTNQIIWSVLRNMNMLFGDETYSANSPMAKLSQSVADSVAKLDISGVCQCLAAFLAGDCRTEGLPSDNSIMCALLSRASGLGLGVTPSPSSYTMASPPAELVKAWSQAVHAFFQLLQKELEKAVERAKKEEDMEKVRSEVPVALIRATLPHANDEQRQQLREMLVTLQ
jgi:DNA topoisomerase 2-associated protein PAT1